VEGKIMVELKAQSELNDIRLAQSINYLEAFELDVGLPINFGEKSLKIKRLINTKR
jgi:GxxExxY protein